MSDLPPCPHLPDADPGLRAVGMRRFGKDDRGESFYLAALETAQALWLRELPAQSLLLINRALGAGLDGSEAVLRGWPLPYAAAAWVMRHRNGEHFLGNPRRHYQHLATRMVPPRREQRSWRAWACWWLARQILPGLPPDEKQLEEENIAEPSPEQIFTALEQHGLPGEAELWRRVADDAGA